MDANTAMAWEAASKYCQDNHGGKLIEFETEEQLEFVVMELVVLEHHDGIKKNWWTSGTDNGQESIWYWASSLTLIPDFIWHGNGNDGTDNNCFYLNKVGGNNYYGNDEKCSDKYFPL